MNTIYFLIFAAAFFAPGASILALMKKDRSFSFVLSIALFSVLLTVFRSFFSLMSFFYLYSAVILFSFIILYYKKEFLIPRWSVPLLIVPVFLSFQDICYGAGDYLVFSASIHKIIASLQFLHYDPILGTPFIDIRYHFSSFPYIVSYPAWVCKLTAIDAYQAFLPGAGFAAAHSLYCLARFCIQKIESRVFFFLTASALVLGGQNSPAERLALILPSGFSLYILLPIFWIAAYKKDRFLLAVIFTAGLFTHLYYSGFMVLFLFSAGILSFFQDKSAALIKTASLFSVVCILFYILSVYNIPVNNSFFLYKGMDAPHIQNFVNNSTVSFSHFWGSAGITRRIFPLSALFFIIALISAFKKTESNQYKIPFIILLPVVLIVVFTPLAAFIAKFITPYKVIRLNQLFFWPFLCALLLEETESAKLRKFFTSIASGIFIFSFLHTDVSGNRAAFNKIGKLLNELIPANSCAVSDPLISMLIPVYTDALSQSYPQIYSSPMTPNAELRNTVFQKIISGTLSEEDQFSLQTDYVIVPPHINPQIAIQKYKLSLEKTLNGWMLFRFP